MIQIEPTTYCNLKCPMCEHSYIKNKGKNMTVNEFKRVVNSFPSFFGKKFFAINFSGIGENLMNPDFIRMLDISKKVIYRTFTDNFTLLNKKIAERIISLKVNRLFISLDGATKKTYESIRRGAKFERVIRNISEFIHLKESLNKKKPKLVIRFVPTKKNIHEFPKLVELAKQIGISFIDIPKFYVSKENRYLQIKPEIFLKYKREALKTAKKLRVVLDFKNQKPEPIKKCFRARNSVYITSKGYVLPCCYVSQFGDYEEITKRYNLGNTNEKSLKEIWNETRYINFRKMIAKNKKPPICQNCQLFD